MLNQLKKHTSSKAKRVGRGYGSSKGGHTSGRGQKGQKSRSGYKAARKGFEGGSMPLSRRIPKLKGFTRGFFKARENVIEISLDDLNVFNAGEDVSIETLIEKNIVSAKSKNNKVKILGNGTLSKNLNIKDLAISKSARKQIEEKGGSVL